MSGDSTASKPVAMGTDETDSVDMHQRLQNYVYDHQVYEEYVPDNLMHFLAQNMKDWRLPDPGRWEARWFQAYRSLGGLASFRKADFNCDGLADFALLLENKADSVTAWILQSTGNSFTPFRLRSYGPFQNKIQAGLELIGPGLLDYLDKNEPARMRLECPAVQLVYFETAAVTYYWKKGQYVPVQTGD